MRYEDYYDNDEDGYILQQRARGSAESPTNRPRKLYCCRKDFIPIVEATDLDKGLWLLLEPRITSVLVFSAVHQLIHTQFVILSLACELR